MIFHWNNVEALARYAPGDVVVALERGLHPDDEVNAETAINLAVQQFRKTLWMLEYFQPEEGEQYPSYFDEDDIAEFEGKITSFREELENSTPIVYIYSTAILFQGSD